MVGDAPLVSRREPRLIKTRTLENSSMRMPPTPSQNFRILGVSVVAQQEASDAALDEGHALSEIRLLFFFGPDHFPFARFAPSALSATNSDSSP